MVCPTNGFGTCSKITKATCGRERALNGFFRFSADSTHNAPVVDLHFTYPDLLTSWVFQLFETSGRRFWVATNRGLAEFFPAGDAQGRRFHFYTARNGLSYHDITALNEDLSGNLWLGTNGVGVMKLALDGFSTFGEQDGVVSVNAIFEDRAGDVCFRGAVLGDAANQRVRGSDAQPVARRRREVTTRGWAASTGSDSTGSRLPP